ncbi:MAG: L-arabinose isomerase family protein [bacterium]
MPNQPAAGLLPLYIELYDDASPETRPGAEAFRDQVADGLRAQGLRLVVAPVARVQREFEAAVERLEDSDVDILVTLHLAYSPSLEAADALCATDLPILALDTTPDYDFGPGVDPARIMYNHGIHGVQDLTSVLRRRGRPYEIVAGHVTESDVLARAADIVRAAHAAQRFRRTNALRIGEAFDGMGDFAVAPDVLKGHLGIPVTQRPPGDLAEYVEGVSDEEVAAEMARDRERFAVDCDEAVHRRSTRVGLGLRRLLETEAVDAISANFMAFDGRPPVDTVPFVELSKAMERGIGYAGEGDVLTASLVGALLAAFPATTFTEIFCPDWRGGALFLSHMGEINPAVAAGRPRLCSRPFPFTAAEKPAILAAAPKPGPAALVNLAPGPDGSFRLIVAEVDVLPDTDREDMQNKVRGWVRPTRPVAEFLEVYSRNGGTHHSALVLGRHAEALAAFARFLGIHCREI